MTLRFSSKVPSKFLRLETSHLKAETSHLKSILSNHTAKLCDVMRFAKIEPCSQECHFTDFVLFLFG